MAVRGAVTKNDTFREGLEQLVCSPTNAIAHEQTEEQALLAVQGDGSTSTEWLS